MSGFGFDPEGKKGIAKTGKAQTVDSYLKKKPENILGQQLRDEQTASHNKGNSAKINKLLQTAITFDQYKQFFRNRLKFPKNFKDESVNEGKYNSIVAELAKIETIDENGIIMVDNPENNVTVGAAINEFIDLYETIYDSIEVRFKMVQDNIKSSLTKLTNYLSYIKSSIDILKNLDNPYDHIEIVNDWYLPDWIAVSEYMEILNNPLSTEQEKIDAMPTFHFNPKQQLRIDSAKVLRSDNTASAPVEELGDFMGQYKGGKTRRKKRTKKRKTKTKTKTKKRKKRKTNKKRKRKTKKRKTNKKKR